MTEPSTVEPHILNFPEVSVSSKRLPVLFLDDIVLLPGMVVPVELDEAAQAAVDAARSSAGSELLIAPRLDGRYAAYGVVASITRGPSVPGSPRTMWSVTRAKSKNSPING